MFYNPQSTVALILTFSVLLGGCSSLYEHHGYGELARSQRIDGKPATPVTLPANAPSITQRYRPAPIASGQGGHNGVDLFLPVGTPILAAADGVVRTVQLSVLYGNQIFVDHGVDEWGDTIQTRYFHLDETRVEEGASVSRGQQIGNSGVTGIYAMFPHLHFEVRRLFEVEGIASHRAIDPQKHWVDGVGKVTCFERSRQWPNTPVRLTYPAPCRDVEWK